jgi:penicillin-binding protein 2
MALAALEYRKRSPEFTISDPGYFTLAGVNHRWRDWKKEGHGSVNMHKSIVISCDTYYYGLANELGIDSIHRFLTLFNFGSKTGSTSTASCRAWRPRRSGSSSASSRSGTPATR